MRRDALRPVNALRIARSLVRRRIGLNRTTVTLADGRRFAVDLNTPLGAGLYRYRSFEDENLAVFADRLRPGDVFIDCGANVGLYTVEAARAVGPTGRVIAFEPADSTRLALLRNVAANGLTQVTVMPYALSDHWGTMSFTVMVDGGGLSSFAPADDVQGQKTTVPVAPLEELVPADLRERIALIKIDVEGAELAALRGARLLLASRPPVFIELEDEHLRRQGASVKEVDEFLVGLGYERVLSMSNSPNALYLAMA